MIKTLVPFKGLSVKLTVKNFNNYKHVINCFEKANISVNENKFIQNNQEIFYYIFKDDYYYFMGDNRHSSFDSREFGFIPKQNILGNAFCIAFSVDANGVRWNRIFEIL